MRLDDNGVLHAKSSREWFELERSGDKPNTLRVVSDEEYGWCHEADLICITHATNADEEPFTRMISGVYDVDGALGPVMSPYRSHQRVVLICWRAQ